MQPCDQCWSCGTNRKKPRQSDVCSCLTTGAVRIYTVHTCARVQTHTRTHIQLTVVSCACVAQCWDVK